MSGENHNQFSSAAPISGLVQFGVFPAREQCLLIVAPNEAAGVLRLPPMALPFTLVNVSEALGDYGCTFDNRPLRSHIYETMTGRFGPAIEQAVRIEREARIKRQKEAELAGISAAVTSNVASVRERAGSHCSRTTWTRRSLKSAG